MNAPVGSIYARLVADLKPANRRLEYAGLLRAALMAGYSVLPLGEFESLQRADGIDAAGRLLVIRHDVDIPNVVGNEMFLAVERAAGVRASYYFRLSTAPSHAAFIRQLLQTGFEVGYHFEEAATLAKRHRLRSREAVFARREEITQLFLENCATFRHSWNSELASAANHGDWINRRLEFRNRDFVDESLLREAGLTFEAYEPRLMAAADVVVEDVTSPPALWSRDYSLGDALRDSRSPIYLLVHERQWNTQPVVNTRANVERLWETAVFDLSGWSAGGRHALQGRAVALRHRYRPASVQVDAPRSPGDASRARDGRARTPDPPEAPPLVTHRSALRAAVATGGPLVAWQAQIIEQLAAVRGVTVVRWIHVPERREPGRAAAGSVSLTPVPVPEALRSLRPPPAAGTEGRQPVASGQVDVLLDLTSHGVAGPFDWAPEIWHFGYGRALSRDASLATLRDYVSASGTTRVALISEPSGRVLREGRVLTTSWWTGYPLDRVLLDTAGWPAAVARDQTSPEGRPEGSSGGVVPRADRSEAGARGSRWSATRAGAPFGALRVAAVGRQISDAAGAFVTQDAWNIGTIDAPISHVLTHPDQVDPVWLPSRPGLYAADPFGLERGAELHVFYEEFDQRTMIGRISHVAIAPDGSTSEPTCVLNPGVHVSYPFIIQHEGRVFMLPEMAASNELVLYEADDFPHRWRRVATMLSGLAVVDASIIEHEGRWWLLASLLDRGPNHSLLVWHAPELTGPWLPHAGNPVKTDARCTRSGGTPFVHEGRLYRPSQDDSRVYGGRVIVNRIDVLTPDFFVERPVVAVAPRRGSQYPDGLHTLSAAGRRTLVDGNARRLAREALRSHAARRLPGLVSAPSAGRQQ